MKKIEDLKDLTKIEQMISNTELDEITKINTVDEISKINTMDEIVELLIVLMILEKDELMYEIMQLEIFKDRCIPYSKIESQNINEADIFERYEVDKSKYNLAKKLQNLNIINNNQEISNQYENDSLMGYSVKTKKYSIQSFDLNLINDDRVTTDYVKFLLEKFSVTDGEQAKDRNNNLPPIGKLASEFLNILELNNEEKFNMLLNVYIESPQYIEPLSKIDVIKTPIDDFDYLINDKFSYKYLNGTGFSVLATRAVLSNNKYYQETVYDKLDKFHVLQKLCQNGEYNMAKLYCEADGFDLSNIQKNAYIQSDGHDHYKLTDFFKKELNALRKSNTELNSIKRYNYTVNKDKVVVDDKSSNHADMDYYEMYIKSPNQLYLLFKNYEDFFNSVHTESNDTLDYSEFVNDLTVENFYKYENYLKYAKYIRELNTAENLEQMEDIYNRVAKISKIKKVDFEVVRKKKRTIDEDREILSDLVVKLILDQDSKFLSRLKDFPYVESRDVFKKFMLIYPIKTLIQYSKDNSDRKSIFIQKWLFENYV